MQPPDASPPLFVGDGPHGLRVWREALELARLTYAASDRLPVHERPVLGMQMRRAAGSVHANIAEGNGRASRADYLRFLGMSWGSLKELDAHLALAAAAGQLPITDVDLVRRQLRRTGQLLHGLRTSLRRGPRAPPDR